jgi:hypothetical protein
VKDKIIARVVVRVPLRSLDNELRLLARAHIRDGLLPEVNASRIWGGYGNGDLCAVCGESIHPKEIEYEIEDQRAGNVRAYHLHVVCYAAWTFECARREHLQRKDQAEQSEHAAIPGETTESMWR